MWNRSYRWQRNARLMAAVAVLVALAASALMLAQTAPARRSLAGARELADELRATSERTIEVVVPASLAAREGTLVYLERADGVAQVIGRVIAVEPDGRARVLVRIRLMAPAAGSASVGGVLKGAPASLDLRDALRLLVSPDTPDEEAMLARDAIWPSIQANVLPAVIDGVVAEVSRKVMNLDEQDQALVAESMELLRRELEPLEEELIDRLATRSWEVVGFKGLAAGVLRTTADSLQNKSQAVADLPSKVVGGKTAAMPAERPFLSEETNRALQAALEEETITFWNENRTAILDAVGRVVSEQWPQLEAAFRERWAGALYERAVVPAWLAGQDKVLEAVQEYANDFAARRLLTRAGGPRLLFAYALRSSLEISDAPLLVFAPAKPGAPDRVVFEPYLR